MPFPFNIDYRISSVPDAPQHSVSIHRGLTTLVGPNGSGKSQILRSLKTALKAHTEGRQVRYLSAGRMSVLETYRSDYDGKRGSPQYENATIGNRSSRRYRHSSETALGDFHTLAARRDLQIKVSERLSRLFKRDIFLQWDAGNLKVSFSRQSEQSDPYSSAREASGLLQLVVLLSAIYDDEVGALLVDEPEVSLHPQLQSFVLQEMIRYAGQPSDQKKKLIVTATHSPEMVYLRKASDLPSVIFCYDLLQNPRQITPDEGELQNRKVQSLISRMSHEHKLTFFCQRPVLLEGPSDEILATGLGRHLSLHLEAAGAQPLPVIGKGQIPVVTKLMKLIGKSPVVIADADAIADGLDLISIYANDKSLNEKAQEQGFTGISEFGRQVYSDFCQLVNEHWADIESKATEHQYWLQNDDENLRQRRSAFATLMSMSVDELDELNNRDKWQAIRLRISSLLAVLENAGCFILRKGTIESYYRHAESVGSGKPEVAIEELENLLQEDAEAIEESYSDLVRALRFAASTEPINEAKAVRELLLSIVAPALALLKEEPETHKLNSLVSRVAGDASDLFGVTANYEGDDPRLDITLKSKVLDVDGFPLDISVNDNPINEVTRQLGL